MIHCFGNRVCVFVLGELGVNEAVMCWCWRWGEG